MSQLIEWIQPLVERLPKFVKLDGTAQAFVLYYYMSNYTGLTMQEIWTIIGLNGGVHMLLHDTACQLQGGCS